MTQTQHTPELAVFKNQSKIYIRPKGAEVGTPSVAQVFIVRGKLSEAEKTANLFAAAPELLEASENALTHLKHFVLPYATCSDDIWSIKEVIKTLEAAITKATGA